MVIRCITATLRAGLANAEFRHLGKRGARQYPILSISCRATMRGSGVLGASIWDSHTPGSRFTAPTICSFAIASVTNRWATASFPKTRPSMERCLTATGGQAVGECLCRCKSCPSIRTMVRAFGVANGRNTFTRNVACENDHYGTTSSREDSRLQPPCDACVPRREDQRPRCATHCRSCA